MQEKYIQNRISFNRSRRVLGRMGAREAVKIGGSLRAPIIPTGAESCASHVQVMCKSCASHVQAIWAFTWNKN